MAGNFSCLKKHRNVARKLVWEGGWVQKKLFDIRWSDVSKCQAGHKEEGGNTTAQNGTKSDGGIPDAFRKWEQKSEEPQRRSVSGKEAL